MRSWAQVWIGDKSMTRSIPRTRRGTALLATLFAVTLLATVTAMASRGARSTASLTANRRAQTVARLMAESGVIAARAHIESLLRHAGDPDALQENVDSDFDRLLTAVSTSNAPVIADSLDDGAFAATVVNASARLDINTAGREGLETLFRTVLDAGTAQRIASRLDARVRGNDRGEAVRHPFESLDEVEAFLGNDARWLAPVAEQLTVDGDGTIDRRHAPRSVLAAAAGSLSDRPTRLVIVARGWQRDALLSREIQAVFAVQGTELRLVRWREMSR